MDIVEAEEAIRIIMMKMAEKGNQIIVVEEEEDILIGTTTTTTEKEELSTEEVIEVVAVQSAVRDRVRCLYLLRSVKDRLCFASMFVCFLSVCLFAGRVLVEFSSRSVTVPVMV